MFTVILIIHVLLAIALIGLILVQHGKGADAGAAFGSGSAGSVFGARGANSFLYKLTVAIASTFFITSLMLAYLASSGYNIKPTNTLMQDSSSIENHKAQTAKPETITDIPADSETDFPADVPKFDQ